ncbi:centriolar coiled-coil protein of 110 kDa isoform X2 [Malaya genurostris]|uniref:centriolar coiled-coil protein of 110 kDa isoform X2 n=1 Tax=Malaya genurostris TaxID=325434 RepID=UPI0026F4025D|nr:centriolar coiled-coil protein of 110 kDa isoform X2 [Malaya genurostris]
MNSNFISAFKIHGVPILPPVISSELRSEIIQYRKRSQEIEMKILEKKLLKQNTIQLYDNVEKQKESSQQITVIESKKSIKSDSLGIPSLCSDIPNSFLKSPDLEKTEQEKFYCSDQASSQPRLIRSNSYTLDYPSPLLMKHINKQCSDIKNTNTIEQIPQEHTNDNIKRSYFKDVQSTHINKQEWVNSSKTPSKAAAHVKKLKSPYKTTKLNSNNRANVKCKTQRKTVDNIKQSVDTCQQKIKEIQDEHDKRLMELLKRQQEEQHELQQNFRRQQAELTKMLLPSKLDQIHTSTPVNTSPNESMINDIQSIPMSFKKLNISSKEFVHNDSQFSMNNLSSQSSLSFQESTEMYKTCVDHSINNRSKIHDCLNSDGINSYIKTIVQTIQDKDLQELYQFRGLDEQSQIQHNAASLINAYARGYLTRRLFQTECVQKVVEIIRDTLLFILDMHHENRTAKRSRSPVDVQRKRTLIQQLTSACDKLHQIFIESSTKQRMEIIRQDREKIKHKLVNRPKTSRSNESSRSVNFKCERSLDKRYRKLQLCSLPDPPQR